MRPGRAFARRALAAAACVAVLGWTSFARSADDGAAIPPAQGFVTDAAHVIGPERSAQLEGFLVQLKQKTGVQFAVLTVDSTAPEDPDAYKTRVVHAWALGDEKHDEVLLLLLAMHEHRVVFETGYGLEGTLPDAWETAMLRDLVVPRMRAGRVADGVTVAVLSCAKRIADEKHVEVAWTGDAVTYDREPARRSGGIPPLLIAFIVFAILSSILRGFGGRGGFLGGGPWIGGGWGGGFGGGGGGGGGFGGFSGGGGGFSSGGGGGGASW